MVTTGGELLECGAREVRPPTVYQSIGVESEAEGKAQLGAETALKRGFR